jgi:hypothetical protein
MQIANICKNNLGNSHESTQVDFPNLKNATAGKTPLKYHASINANLTTNKRIQPEI